MMVINESNEIEIERAHRLGGKSDDGKPQPVVAKFLRYQNKEYIWKSAYLLKGTKIKTADRFPKEIAEACKKLIRNTLFLKWPALQGIINQL